MGPLNEATGVRRALRERSGCWGQSGSHLLRARVKQRSGTISESVRLVRGNDGGTIAMRIEYLAAIAIAAFAAGTGLAVHSVGSKQSTPAAAQLATRLAESVDPFLLRTGG
jgi:hypothetical protein